MYHYKSQLFEGIAKVLTSHLLRHITLIFFKKVPL